MEIEIETNQQLSRGQWSWVLVTSHLLSWSHASPSLPFRSGVGDSEHLGRGETRKNRRGAVHLPLSQIAEEEQKSDSASSQCLLSTVHLPHTANIFCHRQNLSRTSTVQIRQIVIVEPLCCAVIRVATLDIYTRYLHLISTLDTNTRYLHYISTLYLHVYLHPVPRTLTRAHKDTSCTCIWRCITLQTKYRKHEQLVRLFYPRKERKQ